MRTVLRSLTMSDAETTVAWNNQPEVKEFYSSHPFLVNIENEHKWYEKILYSNLPTTVFGIVFTETQELIGLTFLNSIDLIHRNAEFAIFIGNPGYKGKGLAREAMVQTLDFGFSNLGLHRISLRVSDDNEKAVRLYQNAGFKTEGLLRECYFINGRFISKYQMSLLNTEYDRQKFFREAEKRREA